MFFTLHSTANYQFSYIIVKSIFLTVKLMGGGGGREIPKDSTPTSSIATHATEYPVGRV